MDYVKEAFPKHENVVDYVMGNLGMNNSKAIYKRKLESGQYINILRTTADKTISLLRFIESVTGLKSLDRYIIYDVLPPGAKLYNESDARREMLEQPEDKIKNAAPLSAAADIVAELRAMNETQKSMLLEMRDLSGYLEAICKELNITKNPAPVED